MKALCKIICVLISCLLLVGCGMNERSNELGKADSTEKSIEDNNETAINEVEIISEVKTNNIFDMQFPEDTYYINSSLNSDVFTFGRKDIYLVSKTGEIINTILREDFDEPVPWDFCENISVKDGKVWDSVGNDITDLFKKENQKIVEGYVCNGKIIVFVSECIETYNSVTYRLIAKDAKGEEINSWSGDVFTENFLRESYDRLVGTKIEYINDNKFVVVEDDTDSKIIDLETDDYWEIDSHDVCAYDGYLFVNGILYDYYSGEVIFNGCDSLGNVLEIELCNKGMLFFSALTDDLVQVCLWNAKDGLVPVNTVDISGMILVDYNYNGGEYGIMSFLNDRGERYSVAVDCFAQMMFEPVKGRAEILTNDCILTDMTPYTIYNLDGTIKKQFEEGCDCFQKIDNQLFYLNPQGKISTYSLE